jgi:hypothetical protein
MVEYKNLLIKKHILKRHAQIDGKQGPKQQLLPLNIMLYIQPHHNDGANQERNDL